MKKIQCLQSIASHQWQSLGAENTPYKINSLACPTAPSAPIENIADMSALSNPKENAATSAKVNGVKDVVEFVYLYSDYIAAFPILATHWGALA